MLRLTGSWELKKTYSLAASVDVDEHLALSLDVEVFIEFRDKEKEHDDSAYDGD